MYSFLLADPFAVLEVEKMIENRLRFYLEIHCF